MRSYFIVSVLLCMISTGCLAEGTSVDLKNIDRTLAREPDYNEQPHYALVVFGPTAEPRCWLVMDGNNCLYFDRNSNGDLTEPDDKIPLDVKATRAINVAKGNGYSGMNVFNIGEVNGLAMNFQFWVREEGAVPSEEFDRSIQKECEANDWETGTLYRIGKDGSGAQNGICLTASPEEAQVTHLDGPLTFAMKWGNRQVFQPWPKRTVLDINIGTPSLPAKNYRHDVFSPLTEHEIPRDLHPVAVLEFPSKTPGGAPLVREIELDDRCCGDTVLTELTTPREAGKGSVKVSLSFPVWAERPVEPATFTVPISEERSKYSEQSYIMFPSSNSAISLSEIKRTLEQQGMQVQEVATEKTKSLVLRVDRATIAIAIARGDEVREVAQALGADSPYASVLEQCDTRLEISYLDIDKLLDEATTMAKVQSVLQNATQGILYNTWDGHLSGPN